MHSTKCSIEKFWSASLERFIEHDPVLYQKCVLYLVKYFECLARQNEFGFMWFDIFYLHLNSWTELMCFFKSYLVQKNLPQMLHFSFLRQSCVVRIWLLKSLGFRNVFSHISHLWSLSKCVFSNLKMIFHNSCICFCGIYFFDDVHWYDSLRPVIEKTIGHM